MPLLLGGHYLPLDKIGGGILGSTFLAEDLHSVSGRRYVVKLLPARKNLTPEHLKQVKDRFRQEAKVLEMLGSEHQQIPSLSAHFELTVLGFSGTKLQSDQTEELFYLVEEYIDGQSLAEELAQRGQFRETEAIAVLHQILPVLQFIHGHEYGVIHEAICPEHILRDRKGRLYLTNFGAVKRVITGGATQNSIESATLLTAPPEQQAGQVMSPSADLYALAVTMLRLLTHQDLQTLFDAKTQSWHWRPYAQVSDRLGDILDKMLQPVAHQRFQSASEVMAALSQMSAELRLTPIQPLQAATEAIHALAQETSVWRQDNQLQNTGRLQVNGRLHPGVERSVKQIETWSKLNPLESSAESIPEAPLVETLPQSVGTKLPTAALTRQHEFFTPNQVSSVQFSEPVEAPSYETRQTATHSVENFRITKVLRQSAILGSGGWFAVAALASFLGTVLASGLWLLMVAGLIFGLLAKGQSLSEKLRLLIIAIASAGLTFLLVPQFFRMFSLAQALPQLLLLALASGLFALILIVLSQLAYDSMPKN